MEFMITLPINHEQIDFLKEKLLDISNLESQNWRNFMSIEDIRNLPIPSGEIREPVFNWLKQFNVDCLDFGDSIKCESSNEVAAKMWNLNLSPKTGELSGKVIIPDNLASNIMFVEGLYQKKTIKIYLMLK